MEVPELTAQKSNATSQNVQELILLVETAVINAQVSHGYGF